MKTAILNQLQSVVSQFADDAVVELSRPEPQFGDWSTNIAMRLAKNLGRNPREIADEIAQKLQAELGDSYTISVEGPGFINIVVPDRELVTGIVGALDNAGDFGTSSTLSGKKVLIEGTDPNPFKQLHIGHVYSNTIGEALAGLYEAAGAIVLRVNYQGDVGMHVAKSLWGMRELLAGADLDSIAEADRAEFMGKAYAKGATAFKEEEAIATDITAINKAVYAEDVDWLDMYKTGRQWSLDYFESQYERLQTHFDDYYFESKTAPVGMQVIEDNKSVFAVSDGALVYKGEQDGLHTRVFVNSEGLPTYEAKELGLAAMKERDHSPDISITFTGNEIVEYFKVIKAVLAKINPEWGERISHIAHGMVRLPDGKMSSRTGDVITADWLLNTVEGMVREQSPDSPSIIPNTLGAIKYALLKHRIGGNIAFDVAESISLEGNSGPYIQYAQARALRVVEQLDQITAPQDVSLQDDERALARLIGQFPEVVSQAREEHSPHQVCTYLFDLAQNFNRFYEHNRVLGDERESLRASLIKATQQTLANGLNILNIPAPDRM